MNRVKLLAAIENNIKTNKISVIIHEPGEGLIEHITTHLRNLYHKNLEYILAVNTNVISIKNIVNTAVNYANAGLPSENPEIVIFLDEFDRNSPSNTDDILQWITSNDVPTNVRFILAQHTDTDFDTNYFEKYKDIYNLSSKHVTHIFEESLAGETMIDNPENDKVIVVNGICNNFAFNKDKIEEYKHKIIDMLGELPENFFSDKGGGWSFLQACQTAFDEQWTGMHLVMEQLFCLGMAINVVKPLLPRPLWQALPGGMPYYVIDTSAM